MKCTHYRNQEQMVVYLGTQSDMPRDVTFRSLCQKINTVGKIRRRNHSSDPKFLDTHTNINWPVKQLDFEIGQKRNWDCPSRTRVRRVGLHEQPWVIKTTIHLHAIALWWTKKWHWKWFVGARACVARDGYFICSPLSYVPSSSFSIIFVLTPARSTSSRDRKSVV